jgi:hypothetical protein
VCASVNLTSGGASQCVSTCVCVNTAADCVRGVRIKRNEHAGCNAESCLADSLMTSMNVSAR